MYVEIYPAHKLRKHGFQSTRWRKNGFCPKGTVNGSSQAANRASKCTGITTGGVFVGNVLLEVFRHSNYSKFRIFHIFHRYMIVYASAITSNAIDVILMVVLFFFQKMSEKCFKKCVTKPGTSLDNSEQVNLTMKHTQCIEMQKTNANVKFTRSDLCLYCCCTNLARDNHRTALITQTMGCQYPCKNGKIRF